MALHWILHFKNSCSEACGITYILLVVLSAAGVITALSPPSLTVGNVLTINATDNYTITCTGSKPVEWIFPQTKEMMSQLMHLSKTSNDTQNTADLIFKQATYKETDRYTCRYKDKPEITSNVYVYVSDPNHLFAPPKNTNFIPPFHFIEVRVNVQSFIPCRTTDPNTRVILARGVTEIKQGSDVIYDPTQGFILNYVSVSGFSGPLFCAAELNGKTEKQDYLITVSIDPSVSDINLVLAAEKDALQSGDDLSISCSIYVNALLGAVDFSWNYPFKESDSRAIITPPTKRTLQRAYVVYEVYSELRINNVSLKDDGQYTCTVHYNKASKNDSISIDVTGDPFLNLKPESKTKEVLEGKGLVELSVVFDSLKVPQQEWLLNGQKITIDYPYSLGKGTMDDMRHSLIIKDPVRGLAGIYTLNAFVDDMNATVSMELIVLSAPVITLTLDGDGFFVPQNHSQQIKCVASAKPTANITWSWQPCNLPNCSFGKWQVLDNLPECSQQIPSIPDVPETRISPDIKVMNTTGGDQTNGTAYAVLGVSMSLSELKVSDTATTSTPVITTGSSQQVSSYPSDMCVSTKGNTSVLMFKTTASGMFKCEAVNEYGSDVSVKKYFPTDIMGGFGFNVSDQSPVDGDKFEMHCLASKLMYKEVHLYSLDLLKDGNFSRRNMSMENISGNFSVDDTSYSHRIKFMIDKISLNHTGKYLCMGIKSMGDPTEVILDLPVREIISPVFTKPLKGLDVTSSSGKEYLLICEADGLPMPTITWYKDNMLLDVHTQGVYVSSDGSRLTIKSANESFSGTYVCEAENRGGMIASNMTLQFGDPDLGEQKDSGIAAAEIGIIVGVLGVLIAAALLVVCFVQRRRNAALNKELENYLMNPDYHYNPELPINEQASCLPYDPKWEFPKDRMKLGVLLGQGAFGRVVKAECIGILDHEPSTSGAVKMVKDYSDKDQIMALMSELKILIHLGQHLNIVNLLGAVTKNIGRGELYVICEYCPFGNVRSFLIKNKDYYVDTMDDGDPILEKRRLQQEEDPKYIKSEEGRPPPLTLKTLLCIAYQVARGMEYLDSKKYIHRDLAARNVLISTDNVVKICDFGLAKDLYQDLEYHKKTDAPVPIKWMALESLTHKIYTIQSDVWSYGIFLWELFSLGGNPYPGIQLDANYIGLLKSGYRMDKPAHATEDIYKVMICCWEEEPECRPKFSMVARVVGEFLETDTRQYYADLNSPYLQVTEVETSDPSKPLLSQMLRDSKRVMNGRYARMPSNTSDTSIPEVPAPGVPKDSVRYVNEKWKKEKGDIMEMQPILDGYINEEPMSPDNFKTDKNNSPSHSKTAVDVHRDSSNPERSTTPETDLEGYLSPKEDKNFFPKDVNALNDVAINMDDEGYLSPETDVFKSNMSTPVAVKQNNVNLGNNEDSKKRTSSGDDSVFYASNSPKKNLQLSSTYVDEQSSGYQGIPLADETTV